MGCQSCFPLARLCTCQHERVQLLFEVAKKDRISNRAHSLFEAGDRAIVTLAMVAITVATQARLDCQGFLGFGGSCIWKLRYVSVQWQRSNNICAKKAAGLFRIAEC